MKERKDRMHCETVCRHIVLSLIDVQASSLCSLESVLLLSVRLILWFLFCSVLKNVAQTASFATTSEWSVNITIISSSEKFTHTLSNDCHEKTRSRKNKFIDFVFV